MILMNDITAMSASRCCFFAAWPDRRHARRKASPTFLFGLPKNSLMHECTTPAMWLTKTMTWSCRTSVASVKFRMSQNPKMASTLRPGIMAFNAELSPPFMFWPMISAPASPKPRASREPILMMVFSSTTVSIGSGACLDVVILWPMSRNQVAHLLTMPLKPVFSLAMRPAGHSFPRRAPRVLLEAWTCSRCCSSWPMVIASSGLFLILPSLAIMRSMGVSTSLFASFENVMAPKPSRKHMKSVCSEFSIASILEPLRRSKTNMKKKCSYSEVVATVG
mmetsp:Transcript_97232/g.275471  ORF Transcript_97232/g.275471 Transcript_97232/m.275471 type:complete len:278 (+) Transcript_97232:913-1746(+)